MFISTDKTKYQENHKAKIKNFNLPFLQRMYMGDETMPLACLLTGRPAFINIRDFVTGKDKTRFSIDFNHIRQKAVDAKHSGVSVDKSNHAPSAIFRSVYLHSPEKINFETNILEFMTMMPICTEYHSYINQDSAKGDITLQCFDKKTWPWILKSKKNFDKFLKDAEIDIVDLTWDLFINHLSDINHMPIRQRLSTNSDTWRVTFR